MKIAHWIIVPRQPIFKLNLKELIEYKYLLSQLVYRDFRASYKQTILGPAWLIIHPLITTIIFTIVFGKIIKISTNDLPQPVFYLSGIICWNYFSECLLRTSTVFKDNATIFSKVYFPRIVVPISISISMFYRMIIHLLLLLAVIMIHNDHQYEFSFLKVVSIVPFLILLLAILGIGLGLIIACLTVRYKDLNFVIVFLLQLTMYTTTVIFPLKASPTEMKAFIQANPITPIIETFRFALFSTGDPNIGTLIYSLSVGILIFSIGFIAFNRVEKTFVDSM